MLTVFALRSPARMWPVSGIVVIREQSLAGGIPGHENRL